MTTKVYYESTMLKTLLFIAVIAAVVALAFLYLEATPVQAPSELNDATRTDRCAQYREEQNIDGNEDVYSLGYKGRIRQLLHGCF